MNILEKINSVLSEGEKTYSLSDYEKYYDIRGFKKEMGYLFHYKSEKIDTSPEEIVRRMIENYLEDDMVSSKSINNFISKVKTLHPELIEMLNTFGGLGDERLFGNVE